MPATTVASPTLSQLRGWDTEYFEAAAAHWQAQAITWTDAFDAVYREAPHPGGTPWRGRAADAALTRVGADRLQVAGAADSLVAAAAAARTGASDVAFAKHNALQVVAAAQAQGFDVDESLSVTDRMSGLSPVLLAHRQAQAQAHAASIRAAATELVAVDGQVAARVSSAMTGLAVQFAEAPLPSPDDEIVDDHHDTAIQAVDFKQNPPQEDPPPLPGEAEVIKLPPRTEPPPVTVIDASPPPMFPNCDTVDVWKHIGGTTVGGLGMLGGALATPFTFGAGLVPLLGGAATAANSLHEFSKCS